MNWNNLTLGQFQEIHKLTQDNSLDEIEKTCRTISILYGKTEAEVDDMDMAEFNKLASELKFLTAEHIPGKPVKSFRVGVNKYAINYKPTSLKYRQYVEILHYSERPIENMHLILASLVNPVKFGIKRKNKVDDHERISLEMQNAPLLAVYHAAVFFCKLFRDLIKHIQDYLIKEMTEKGATREQAMELIADSISAMDGFIQLNK